MNLAKLLETKEILLQHMRNAGYAHDYILNFSRELQWIKANAEKYVFDSYEELCQIRLGLIKDCYASHLRSMYGIFMRFEENGEFPDRQMHNPIFKRATYYKLSPYYKNLIDLFVIDAQNKMYQKSTTEKCKSKCSCFFMHLQSIGFSSLEDVDEKAVLAFFVSKEGESIRSRSYKRDIAMVLNSNLAEHSFFAKRLATFLPPIPKRCKNIQFLTTEESDAIHKALTDKTSLLSARDRAIGLLLYFTGIRAGDIADLRLHEIDWKNDLIIRYQGKTGNLIELPLIPVVGNALYEYISSERPKTEDNHIFLWSKPPFAVLSSNAIWVVCKKIYAVSGIRQTPQDRKGSHLFRHHLATHLASQGITQPIISSTLGHSEPTSLSCYLAADIKHLRELALTIEDFPINKEVFKL